MAEELSTLHKLHEEEDAVLVLEYVLHVNQEWMIDLAKDVLLQLDVLHLLVFQDDILANDLHGVHLLRCHVLDEEHLTERALSDHLDNLKVF